MQVRFPIGFDPIVNLNFKLVTNIEYYISLKHKIQKNQIYVLNLVKVRMFRVDHNFNIYDHWIFNRKFECLIVQSCNMNLNYEMSQKIRRKKFNPLEKFN